MTATILKLAFNPYLSFGLAFSNSHPWFSL